MERQATTKLRIGDMGVNQGLARFTKWRQDNARVRCGRGGCCCAFAERAGEVVRCEDLLNPVSSLTTVAPDRSTGGGGLASPFCGRRPQANRVHRTVTRLGYRMVATVTPWTDQPVAHAGKQENGNTNGPFSEISFSEGLG